jgi:hypothetical protein
MPNQGDIIYGADYNTVQAKVRGVLGDGGIYWSNGSGDYSYGYGYPVTCALVEPNAIITALQWNDLLNDVNTAYTHITGNDYIGYTSAVNNPISHVYLNDANTAINYAISKRLSVAATRQSLNANAFSNTYNGDAVPWGGGSSYSPSGISSTFTLSFASADAARYYFNRGNYLRVFGTYSGDNNIPQNGYWNELMAKVAYKIDYNEWHYIQANNASSFTTITGGSVYASNYVSITASEVTSTSVKFTVLYKDDHTSIWSDSVTGQIGYKLTENYETYWTGYPVTISGTDFAGNN